MKPLLFFLVMLLAALPANAQIKPCYTDEAGKMAEKLHPEIAVYRAQLEQQIQAALQHIDYSKAKLVGKTTVGQYYGDSTYYDIPIVVHVIHDYGSEYENTTDNDIFNAVAGWDSVYICHNSDTSSVIPPFKKYIGNPQIRLHLATIDPNGDSTKGITRHRSYLTHATASNLYTAADQAKLDDWPASSYVNIWVENALGAGATAAAAYAYEPPDAAAIPYYDGVIVLNSDDNNSDNLYLANQPYTAGEVGKTINHEIGHVFDLYHPWGMTNFPQVACGDDEVDDTPPTKGHLPTGCVYNMSANGLYDTACCQHYFKVYPSTVPGVDSLVDYPDTANSQNIMDYTYCARMFTKGQVERMHIALNSDVAKRDSLWSPFNLQITGALAPRPDLAPIPAYSAWASTMNTNTVGTLKYFGVVGGAPIYFRNESWNDTILSVNWTFSNDASVASKTVTASNQLSSSFADSFGTAGWLTLTLTATGNVGGTVPGRSTTLVDSTSIYIADSTGVNPTGYYEEFNGGDVGKWPMFNYYNNNFKWQIANTGFYDNSSVEYVGYDSRSFPETVVGAPTGDFDDLFSPSFNLTGFGSGACDLDFMYSGQTRSSLAYNMNDSLAIYYSTDLGDSWNFLSKMTGTTLDNQGVSSNPYTPTWQGAWSPETITVPAAARSMHTIFRFRYYPDQDENNTFSTGNNFYMDRISINSVPEEVNILPTNANGVSVVPNPTHGDAYVLINNTGNSVVKVQVTDIAGRVVYTTQQEIIGAGRIMIPQSAISVSGMYLVQVVNGNQARTEKLVVY